MKLPLRPVLALTASAALLFGAGAATAAPASCNLVKDKVGDGTGFVFTDMDYTPNNPNLDLVSGDIGSNAKTITAVIRTDKLDLSDANSPTGRTYFANFTANGVELYLSVALDGAGVGSYSAGYIDTRRMFLSGATGVVDTKKKEVRISAPISVFASKANLKPGTAITDLNLLAQRYIGERTATGVTPSADEAVGGAAYTAGAKSCVKPGK